MAGKSRIEVACDAIQNELLLFSQGLTKHYIFHDLKQRKKIHPNTAGKALKRLTDKGAIVRCKSGLYNRPSSH